MAEFIGHNGQFAGGRVHTVAMQRWMDGKQVPGPACRTPSGTFDPRDFKPTRETLSCERCKKWHPNAGVLDPSQFVLNLELPERESVTT
jgi:hypothetical protein